MPLPTSLLRSLSDELSGLVSRVLPAVVAIADKRDGESIGSGFLIDTAGHVVTNHHVVADGETGDEAADETGGRAGKAGGGSGAAGDEAGFWVTRHGRPPQEARLLGADQFTDLAVLRLVEPAAEHVRLRAEPVRLGELCFAVGSPLGFLTESVTCGVVSGVARTFGHRRSTRPIERGIQVDCAINPGNSGGPVFDAAGEVIGVATASANRADNVAFAVPAVTVAAIAPELISYGKVLRASLGVGVASRPVEYAGKTLPRQTVVRVNQEATTGLRVGDVILRIGDTEVDGRAALYDHLGRDSIGKPLTLEVLRDGEVLMVTITATAFAK